MKKRKEIGIILCEHCEQGYDCKILNPSICKNNFCLAVSSNFDSKLELGSFENEIYD